MTPLFYLLTNKQKKSSFSLSTLGLSNQSPIELQLNFFFAGRLLAQSVSRRGAEGTYRSSLLATFGPDKSFPPVLLLSRWATATRKMSTVHIKYRSGQQPGNSSDPRESPVIFIGLAPNLAKVNYGLVKHRLGNVVNAKVVTTVDRFSF